MFWNNLIFDVQKKNNKTMTITPVVITARLKEIYCLNSY